jgi:acyl-CoA dehydrogenase
LILGELFTLVTYGQLVIENAKIYKIEDDLLDQIFDYMIRDFSKYALQLYSKISSTRLQMLLCHQMIRKPIPDAERFKRLWEGHVLPYKDSYSMNP